MIDGADIALVTLHIGVLPCMRYSARRMIYLLTERGSASRLDNLNFTRPSRRPPAKIIRLTILARSWCQDRLNAPITCRYLHDRDLSNVASASASDP